MKYFWINYTVLYVLLLFCRCNNVMYIRGVEEEDEEGEMKDWTTTCHTHHPTLPSLLQPFSHLHSFSSSSSSYFDAVLWVLLIQLCNYCSKFVFSVCQYVYEQQWVNFNLLLQHWNCEFCVSMSVWAMMSECVCESICTTRL